MIDETENLILECMRKFEPSLGEMRHDLHGMREELQGVNRRLSNLEEGQALTRRRLDRLDERRTPASGGSIWWKDK